MHELTNVCYFIYLETLLLSQYLKMSSRSIIDKNIIPCLLYWDIY
jgi:hypothetical protein